MEKTYNQKNREELKKKLQFYNTKTRKVEIFKPFNANKVTLYSCGPTVYSYQHIGNLKAALSWDILRRVLKYVGYNVYSVQNITDVGHLTDDDDLSDMGEDKMIKTAKKEKKTPLEVAQFYTDYYLNDLKKLHIILPNIMPKATDHILEQLQMIEKLEQNGHTYTTDDGVYFDVSTFKEYGSLSGQKLEEKEAGARVEVNSNKRNPQDFALWKFVVGDNENHSMKWDSKWGVGFPGWHIECSAMGHKYLGENIDIHTGGVDHIPIHHENEIAQNTCSNCIKHVSFWMHNGHITFNGEKMSKSLGNIYLISDLEEKGYSALSYRMLLLQSHYRKSGDISFQSLEDAQNNIEKIHHSYWNILKLKPSSITNNNALHSQIDGLLTSFNECIIDDLNTAKSLKYVYEVMKIVNKIVEISQDDKLKIISFFKTVDEILGILEEEKTIDIPQEIINLANKRAQYKRDKNFEKSDSIREIIKAKGFEIKDDSSVDKGYILLKSK